MTFRLLQFCFVLLGFAALAAGQTTRMVPSQYPTIQNAIVAATNGDTVLVSPGVYNESINYLAKDLNVKSSMGAATTTIRGNFSGRVVTMAIGTPATAVLDGFTIKDGAGGVIIDTNSATVRNCVFQNNATSGLYGGGGILITCQPSQTMAPTILDCDFVGNLSVQGGGGICIDVLDSGTATGTCLPIIQRCTFSMNFAQGTNANSCNNGGTPCAFNGGGGIAMRKRNNFGNLTVSVNDCEFTSNGSQRLGGAVNIDQADSITISGCRFIGNAALGNQAIGGGAVAAKGCTLHLANCLIAGNTGTLTGGGLTVRPWTGGNATGVTFEGCTIVDNSATQGGGVYIDSGVSCTFANTILWGNSSADLFAFASVNATYCCIGAGPIVGSASNVNLDPLFVDRFGGDYHLSRSSPLVDSGDPFAITGSVFDLDGAPRLSGLKVDIGVDEVPVAPLPGSNEDLELHTLKLTGGDPHATTLGLAAGDVLVVRLKSPGGTFVGANPLVVGQPYTTGFPPASPPGLPGVHLDGFMLQIVYGATANGFLSGATLPTEGVALYYSVPPGLVGFSFRLQGFVVSPFAMNAAYAVTEAHDLDF